MTPWTGNSDFQRSVTWSNLLKEIQFKRRKNGENHKWEWRWLVMIIAFLYTGAKSDFFPPPSTMRDQDERWRLWYCQNSWVEGLQWKWTLKSEHLWDKQKRNEKQKLQTRWCEYSGEESTRLGVHWLQFLTTVFKRRHEDSSPAEIKP